MIQPVSGSNGIQGTPTQPPSTTNTDETITSRENPANTTNPALADADLTTSQGIAAQGRLQKKVTISSLASTLDIEQIKGAQNLGIKVELPLEFELAILSAIEHEQGLTPNILKTTKDKKRESGHHITLVKPTESKLLSTDPQRVLDELLKLNFGQITVTGIGTLRKDSSEPGKSKVTYFATVQSKGLEKFMTALGLNPEGLHITLGFINGDVHSNPGDPPKAKDPYLTSQVSSELYERVYSGGPEIWIHDLPLNVSEIDLPPRPQQEVKQKSPSKPSSPISPEIKPEQLQVIVEAVRVRLNTEKAQIIEDNAKSLGSNLNVRTLQKALGPKLREDLAIINEIISLTLKTS